MAGKEKLYEDMELSVLDRLMLAEVLPTHADVTALRLIRKFKEALSFSQEEHSVLKFRIGPEGKGLFWEDEGAAAIGLKTVRIPAKVYLMLQDKFKELDGKELLTEAHLDLYERIVE